MNKPDCFYDDPQNKEWTFIDQLNIGCGAGNDFGFYAAVYLEPVDWGRSRVSIRMDSSRRVARAKTWVLALPISSSPSLTKIAALSIDGLIPTTCNRHYSLTDNTYVTSTGREVKFLDNPTGPKQMGLGHRRDGRPEYRWHDQS